ncbi:uncharacterized protein LOC144085712 isoform X12 [Stigmatopora argus]
MPNRKRKLLLVKMLPARAFANVSAKHLSHSQKPESPKMKEEDAESPQIKTDEEVTTWTFEFGPSQSETDDKDVSEKHLSHSQKRVSPKTDEEVTTWTFEFCPSQSENDDKDVSAKHLSHSQKPESPKMKEEEAESPQIKTDEEVTTWTFEFGPSQSETDDKDVSEKHLSHSQKPESPKTNEEVTTWTFEFGPSQSENDDKGVSEKHLSQCQMSVSSNIKEEEETGSLQIKKEAEEVNVTNLTSLKVPSKSEDYNKDVSGLPETPHIKKEEEQFPYIKEEEYEMNITALPLTCVALKTENEDKVPIIETIQALPPSTSSNDMKDDADRCGPSQCSSDIESAVRKLLRCIKKPQNQTVKGNVEQQSIHIHASDTAIGSRTGTSQSPRQNTFLQEKQRALPFTINFASKRRKTSTPGNCARLRLFHFCLMPENSDRTPKDEAVLLHAGLGRRTVILSEGATNTEITTVLLKEYPKLQSLRGGWLLQQASGRPGQRKLSPVPQTSVGYTAKTLSLCSQKGKDTIYIVPIQEQIDTSPLPFDAPEFANMPKNTCMACGASVPLLMLPFHMKSCYSEAVNDVNDV